MRHLTTQFPARIAFILMSLAGAAPALAADAAAVPYPQNHRNWYHVQRMVINPGHGLYDAFGGIHHLYAHATALKRYRIRPRAVDPGHVLTLPHD